MGHFKLVFGSGNSDLAKIRRLKVGPPAINWKSSLFLNMNFHRSWMVKRKNRFLSKSFFHLEKEFLLRSENLGKILVFAEKKTSDVFFLKYNLGFLGS